MTFTHHISVLTFALSFILSTTAHMTMAQAADELAVKCIGAETLQADKKACVVKPYKFAQADMNTYKISLGLKRVQRPATAGVLTLPLTIDSIDGVDIATIDSASLKKAFEEECTSEGDSNSTIKDFVFNGKDSTATCILEPDAYNCEEGTLKGKSCIVLDLADASLDGLQNKKRRFWLSAEAGLVAQPVADMITGLGYSSPMTCNETKTIEGGFWNMKGKKININGTEVCILQNGLNFQGSVEFSLIDYLETVVKAHQIPTGIRFSEYIKTHPEIDLSKVGLITATMATKKEKYTSCPPGTTGLNDKFCVVNAN